MTVLMSDASPTPVLSRFKTPTPASSVSWSLELRPLSLQEPLEGWWRAEQSRRRRVGRLCESAIDAVGTKRCAGRVDVSGS